MGALRNPVEVMLVGTVLLGLNKVKRHFVNRFMVCFKCFWFHKIMDDHNVHARSAAINPKVCFDAVLMITEEGIYSEAVLNEIVEYLPKYFLEKLLLVHEEVVLLIISFTETQNIGNECLSSKAQFQIKQYLR